MRAAQETSKLQPTPCQRCGCHMTWYFKCGCGQVHGDVCGNCGLRRPLQGETTPEKYLTLSAIDVMCEAGTSMHEHSSEEKSKRIDAFFNRCREAN